MSKPPETRRKINIALGWMWIAIGMLGLATYVTGWGPNIADSVPVLFFISVYANGIGHWSAGAANKAEGSD